MLLSLVIATLLPGQALAAGHLASPGRHRAAWCAAAKALRGPARRLCLPGPRAPRGRPERLRAGGARPTRWSAPLPDIVEGIAVSDDTVYAADGEGGLHIIEVTNPAAPESGRAGSDTPASRRMSPSLRITPMSPTGMAACASWMSRIHSADRGGG